MKNSVDSFVASVLVDRLDDYVGKTVYYYDLAYNLLEEENINGSYFCNTYKSILWIKKYFEDLRDIVEEYERVLGESPANPFKEPDKFMVQIMIFVADYIMNDTYFINNLEDEQIELTQEVIDVLKAELTEPMEAIDGFSN